MMDWSPIHDAAVICDYVAVGGVFAYPTEAVYGLGGDPGNAETVKRIIAMKAGRPINKGLIMVAGNWAQCAGWIGEVAPADQAEMWQLGENRATTFILPAGEKVAALLTDDQTGRVALRISRHPVVVALCNLLTQPLISTSANVSGAAAARSVAEVRTYFPNIPVVRGALGRENRPSRIIDWADKQILRT